jgi:phenylalanyl-tRNA synthetase beta chain
MRVPLSWLRDSVDLVLPTTELAERLTLAGLAVDAIEQVGDWWDPEFIRVAEVVAVLPHPDADRLTLVDIDFGGESTERVVTGAPNIFAFKGCTKADGTLPVLKAPFARSGATLLDAYSEERPRPFKKLKPSKIRGVLSNGMVCSERELGLSEEHEGILLLPADAPVGMPLRDYLGDEILELDLTPDMARTLSMAGVAREVAALTGGGLHLPAPLADAGRAPLAQPLGPATLSAPDGRTLVTVQIDDPALCNRYTGMVIEGVTVGPSPAWMRARLARAGMRPISNVVDITNYVMLALGQPLHAFDYDVLVQRAARVGEATPTIIVRRAAANERFTTLDGVARTLTDDVLMIADRAGSVAIAGVMGGLESEVSDSTRTILLESATFDPGSTRRTANALKLYSEASYRFIRGVPATLNHLAARYAAQLLVELAGGRIVEGPDGAVADAYPVPQPARTVYTTASDMRRLLGMPLTLDEIAAALERLDFAVSHVEEPAADAAPAATFALARQPGEPLLACTAPWFRLDIAMPADLTEEVARIIGYERVGMTLLSDELPPQRRNERYETEERIRNILTGAGLQETVNYTLTAPESHARLTPGHAVDEAGFVTLANPIAPERRSLRRALLTSALENLARNARLAPRHAHFEVGRVYLPEAGDGVLPLEDRRVSILLAGQRTVTDFHNAEGSGEYDFFDLKGVVEALLDRLGFTRSQVEFHADPDTPPFGPRCASIHLDGAVIGHMGEVHPRVRQAFDLPDLRVAAAELRIEPLVRPHFRITPMRPISPYPATSEDLAFEVDESVTVRSLEQAIRSAGGFLLTEVELFDIFRGGTLTAGRKSVAFHLSYQSPDRPLVEREVAALRRRIIDAVVKETGATLRG